MAVSRLLHPPLTIHCSLPRDQSNILRSWLSFFGRIPSGVDPGSAANWKELSPFFEEQHLWLFVVIFAYDLLCYIFLSIWTAAFDLIFSGIIILRKWNTKRNTSEIKILEVGKTERTGKIYNKTSKRNEFFGGAVTVSFRHMIAG